MAFKKAHVNLCLSYIQEYLSWWLSSKEPTCNTGNASSIPGLGESHGK